VEIDFLVLDAGQETVTDYFEDSVEVIESLS
jgi:hypothetical protein